MFSVVKSEGYGFAVLIPFSLSCSRAAAGRRECFYAASRRSAAPMAIARQAEL
jgi:hypothetical protein